MGKGIQRSTGIDEFAPEVAFYNVAKDHFAKCIEGIFDSHKRTSHIPSPKCMLETTKIIYHLKLDCGKQRITAFTYSCTKQVIFRCCRQRNQK